MCRHENEIIDRLKTIEGNVGFYYKNLVTEEEIQFRAEECFVAASIIKVPIVAEILRQADINKDIMTEKIVVRQEEMLPSCGALNLFEEEPEVSIGTLCNFMIAVSDNTATNVLINHFGIEQLNCGFEQLGLKKTKLNRLLFDAEAAERGIENFFEPREIGELLESVYNGKFVNKNVSKQFEKILLKQEFNHKIPGRLEEKIDVGHKTGDDDGISHDVGIVYAKKPFLVAFASNHVYVPEFNEVIMDITYELCDIH